MKALMLIAAITVVTLAMAYFAIGAVSPGGFYLGDVGEAQIVRKSCRVRLVQPEWVSSKPSTLMNWCVAETYARLGVVAIFWLGAVVFTIRFEVSGNENLDAN